MRDVWYSSSYLLDRKQSMNGCAKKRFENYKMQPLDLVFRPEFKGKLRNTASTRTVVPRPVSVPPLSAKREPTANAKMAYSLYLAGFDVKDVTMTDLISGRETLEDVNMVVYCGASPTPTYWVPPKVGQALSSSTESQRGARQVLCTRRHAVSRRMQRLPAYDGIRPHHSRPRKEGKDAA